MSNQELIRSLETRQCNIHRRKAVFAIRDGRVEIEEYCCETFKEVLTGIVDEELHQRFADDLDSLFE